MKNALSVDVEEYYHVTAFESVIAKNTWSGIESRVEDSVRLILDLLAVHRARATFFVLGWLAENHPELIREIAAAGHEIASHGYAHRLIYQGTPEDFRADLTRSRRVIEDITGERVIGYRAPSYSITTDSLWALDILIEQGFLYDSSIFPIHHDRYGIPHTQRFPHLIRRDGGSIVEFPLTTYRLFGLNLPVAGGGYLRFLPCSLVIWSIQAINNRHGKPAIIYFHPWELDPDQPRQPVGPVTRFRHYANIRRMKAKIERLLATFSFAPVREILQITDEVSMGSGGPNR